MNLEQRVQLLEDEVQLLKNQIQHTLLTIQEHILTNTYPSLRAEEAPDPAPRPIEYATEQAKTLPHPRIVEGLQGVNRVSFNGGETANTIPSLNNPHPTNLPTPLIMGEPVLEKQPPAIDWANLNKMDEWVSKKIDKMGVARTRKLIEFYAAQGRFNENVVATLMQLVDLYQEEIDPAIEKQHFNEAPNIDDTLPIFNPPQELYFSDLTLLAESRISEISTHQNSDLITVLNPTNGNGHRKTEIGEQPDAPRRMILKLIAGLQNAGMDWKRPNG